jgi:predicted RNase H-like nuclease (RuvC/YqgF family)
LDQLQQSHANHVMIFNEQITKLQAELLKKADEVEILADENSQLHLALGDMQRNIRNTHVSLEQSKTQFQETLEEKRREIYLLQQTRDQQLFTLKKEYQDERAMLM